MALRSKNLVELVIGVKDNATAVLLRINRAVSDLRLGFVALGATITATLSGLGLSRLFSGAIDSAADFEQQMAKVQAVTNASAEDFEKLKKAAEDAGATTKFTATESAQALEVLARSGLSATQAIEALPQVLSLAAAEGLELAESSGFITKTLAQYNLSVAEASRVTDVLVKTSQSANTNVREVGNALSYAGLLAKDADVSLEETAAIIGKLADAGIAGERAGTALRSILSQLADPASKARKELEQLGDTSGDLTTALDTIRAAGQRGNAALLAFGTEAAPALRALVNVGKPALDQLTESLQNAQGTADKAAATMGGTLQGALTRLGSAWDALKRTVVQPLLKPIADDVNQLAVAIGDFVQGGRLSQLQASLLQTFKESSAAAKAFFQNFDFDKFTADLGNFVRETTSAFSTLTTVASVAANTLSIAFNGLKVALSTARFGFNKVAGDTQAAAVALQDLEAATTGARSAMQRMGLISEDVKDVIEAVSRETYDAAAAQERLNSTTYETAESLQRIPPAAAAAGNAVNQLGAQANNAAGAVNKLNQSASATGEKVEKSIGGLTAAFDGSAESARKVAEGLGETAQATEKTNQAAQDYGRTVEKVDKQTRKAADGAQQYAKSIAGLINQTRTELAALSDTAAAVFDALIPDVADSSVTLLNRNIQAMAASLRGADTEAAKLNTQLEQTAKAVDFFAERSQFAEPLSRAFFNVQLAASRVKEEFFSQKLALDDLLNRFDDLSATGGAGLAQLANRAERTANSFTLLSDTDLSPLRQQIASVRNELQQLDAQAQDTLESLRERLLRLRGDETQLLALQYERERLEIEQQLQEAKAKGDRDAIAALEKSLKLLREINKEEAARLRARQQEQSQAAKNHAQQLAHERSLLLLQEQREKAASQNRTARNPAPLPIAQPASGAKPVTITINSNIFDPRTLQDVTRQIEKELKRIGALTA